MDNAIIQAYLWRDVIRLGFSPTGTDIKRWLVMYGKNLKDFWGIDEYPLPPKSNGAITAELTCVASLKMILSYTISSISKYTVQFLYMPQNRELMWVHDVDGSYFSFPEQIFLTKYNRHPEVVKNINDNHIKTVLDGLIFHPKVHQHIESPIDKHEIRIGGGIDNPFLYLFHLRYQLCPIKKNVRRKKSGL